MQLYVTYAAQAVKHLVDNLRLVSVATLPSCGSYAAALHLSRRPQAKQPVATAAQRKQAAQRPRSSRESPFRGDGGTAARPHGQPDTSPVPELRFSAPQGSSKYSVRKTDVRWFHPRGRIV